MLVRLTPTAACGGVGGGEKAGRHRFIVAADVPMWPMPLLRTTQQSRTRHQPDTGHDPIQLYQISPEIHGIRKQRIHRMVVVI